MHEAKIKTKIVCTIGPATWDNNVLQQLINNGMTVARINASFADAVEIKRVTKQIRELSSEVAILLDLKGHKIRLSDFGEPIDLMPGEEFIIDTDLKSKFVQVSYSDLHKDIKVGAAILIDDGKVRLEVVDIKGTQIVTKVKNKSTLKRLKTVNVPGTFLSFDPLTEKDKEDIQAGLEVEVDLIAGSFVRNIEDVIAIEERIKGSNIGIIAKIEDPLGVENFDSILERVYGIMIARGDLGVELPYEQIPILQKEFIQKCNEAGKPVIVATHMLESMTSSPSPTRAEVSDVANAIFDGTDAIMTSAETSTGAYPIEAIVTMNTVARNVERLLKQKYDIYANQHELFALNQKEDNEINNSAYAIARAAGEVARHLPVKGVFVLSKGGFTARLISKQCITQNIYALVKDLRNEMKLCLSYGVYPHLYDFKFDTREDLIKSTMEFIKSNTLATVGDLICIVAGSVEIEGKRSSLIEVREVE